MDQISPHDLWIGHAGDGRDFVALHQVGIEIVVQLAIEEVPLTLPRDFMSARFPLHDGTGNRPEILDLAVHFVCRAIASRLPLLVCCGAGLSRSPAIVSAALARLGEGAPDECLARVSRSRRVDVSPALWAELRRVDTAF